MIIFLDSGILSNLSHPNPTRDISQCQEWFYYLLGKGVTFFSSVVCDYEVRRGIMVAMGKGASSDGLKELDFLENFIDYLVVDQKVAQQASKFWAEARLQGTPTADNKILDADMLIISHWHFLQEENPGQYVVIATTNIKHLSLFAEAQNWQNIRF